MAGSSAKWHNDYARVPDEAQQTFKIDKDFKIPEISQLRPRESRTERMDSLLSMPLHRSGTIKFNGDMANLTLIPLTQEDKEQSINLPLLNTLRQPFTSMGSPSGKPETTNPNPPSFYDAD